MHRINLALSRAVVLILVVVCLGHAAWSLAQARRPRAVDRVGGVLADPVHVQHLLDLAHRTGQMTWGYISTWPMQSREADPSRLAQASYALVPLRLEPGPAGLVVLVDQSGWSQAQRQGLARSWATHLHPLSADLAVMLRMDLPDPKPRVSP